MDELKLLSEVIKQRKEKREEGSYTCYLFDKGIDKILKKCGEECSEMIIAAKNNNKEEIKAEVCDLLYHILVMLAERGVTIEEIAAELNIRSRKTGNLKQFKTTDKNS